MSSLRIGLKPWAPHGPLALAKELGFLNGLNVEFVLSEDEAEKETEFANGNLHGLGTTLDYVPFLAQHTPSVRAFLKLGESAGADAIVASSGIRQATDLRGRTVGLEPPGTSQLLLMEYINKNGFSYEQVNVIKVLHDQTPDALARGEVDAIVTWEPYVQAALAAAPGAHILTTSADTPGLIVEVLVATDNALQQHHDTFAGLAHAQLRAVQHLTRQPSESADLLARALNTTQSDMTAMLTSVTIAGADENRAAFGAIDQTCPLESLVERLGRLWKDVHLIERLTVPMVNGGAVRNALART